MPSEARKYFKKGGKKKKNTQKTILNGLQYARKSRSNEFAYDWEVWEAEKIRQRWQHNMTNMITYVLT